MISQNITKVQLFCLAFVIFFIPNSVLAQSLETEKSTPPEGLHLALTPKLNHFCTKLGSSFKKYKWGESECENFSWYHVRNSVLGDPLIWTVFGDIGDDHDKTALNRKDVTMVMCGVHGDEITPIKFCFDLMYYLRDSLKDENFKKSFENKVVVIAPLVNPDSYFKMRPTRTNARGVDVNRNFPTNDWYKEAQKVWISKYRRDKRRNPGKIPGSEPETVFQLNLIKRYSPDKIISVHSPLSLIDYDGPSLPLGASEGLTKAEELLIQMSKNAADYRIQNYPFFPGSLGNWAGQERSIPTYTLELPTSDPRKSREYWALFKEAMHKAVFHDVRSFVDGHMGANPKIELEKAKVEGITPVRETQSGQMP